METKLKINAIKTNAGFYVQTQRDAGAYRQGSGLGNLLINGELPEKTFDENWSKVKKAPKKVEKKEYVPPTNYRYELIDKSLATDKIPLVFARDSVAIGDDNSGDVCWKPEFSHLQSLYQLKSDEQPNKTVEVEFELDILCEVPHLSEYLDAAYKVKKGQWESEGYELVSVKNAAQHQELDKIVFPDLLLPSRPSKLSSKLTYRIIRQHVKDNIDPKFAEITSDYDFCFTVQKKIKLAEPYSHQWESHVSKNRTVTKKEWVTSRPVTIFEMTSEEDHYKGYTPIAGFQGKNHEDLVQNINKFLAELMDKINKPIVECTHCSGRGVTF